MASPADKDTTPRQSFLDRFEERDVTVPGVEIPTDGTKSVNGSRDTSSSNGDSPLISASKYPLKNDEAAVDVGRELIENHDEVTDAGSESVKNEAEVRDVGSESVKVDDGSVSVISGSESLQNKNGSVNARGESVKNEDDFVNAAGATVTADNGNSITVTDNEPNDADSVYASVNSTPTRHRSNRLPSPTGSTSSTDSNALYGTNNPEKQLENVVQAYRAIRRRLVIADQQSAELVLENEALIQGNENLTDENEKLAQENEELTERVHQFEAGLESIGANTYRILSEVGLATVMATPTRRTQSRRTSILDEIAVAPLSPLSRSASQGSMPASPIRRGPSRTIYPSGGGFHQRSPSRITYQSGSPSPRRVSMIHAGPPGPPPTSPLPPIPTVGRANGTLRRASGAYNLRSASPSKDTFSPALRNYSGANPFELPGRNGKLTEFAEELDKPWKERSGREEMDTFMQELEAMKVAEERKDRKEGKSCGE